jgi:hypothetical protein
MSGWIGTSGGIRGVLVRKISIFRVLVFVSIPDVTTRDPNMQQLFFDGRAPLGRTAGGRSGWLVYLWLKVFALKMRRIEGRIAEGGSLEWEGLKGRWLEGG